MFHSTPLRARLRTPSNRPLCFLHDHGVYEISDLDLLPISRFLSTPLENGEREEIPTLQGNSNSSASPNCTALIMFRSPPRFTLHPRVCTCAFVQKEGWSRKERGKKALEAVVASASCCPRQQHSSNYVSPFLKSGIQSSKGRCPSRKQRFVQSFVIRRSSRTKAKGKRSGGIERVSNRVNKIAGINTTGNKNNVDAR